MIAVIFLIAMLSSILLSLMGALPFWASGGIILGSLIGLGLLGLSEQQQRLRVRRRSRQLQARWGLRAVHLGGLPVPLETPAVLYRLNDHYRLETDFDYWQIPLADVQKTLVISADAIRKLSDKQLSEQLASGNIRSFSSLREKIRHHDKSVRSHGILMITHKPVNSETRLLILATQLRTTALNNYFARPAYGIMPENN